MQFVRQLLNKRLIFAKINACARNSFGEHHNYSGNTEGQDFACSADSGQLHLGLFTFWTLKLGTHMSKHFLLPAGEFRHVVILW